MDAIHGITMEQMATFSAKWSELKSKHDDKTADKEFDAYLRTQGFDLSTYSNSWNGWWERFRADPTGRLEAQYHQIESKLLQAAHFGDVRDMTSDTQEGVTLDTYAKVCAALSAPGADVAKTLKEHGIASEDKWKAVSAAWTDAMSKDTTFALAMQYGNLYSQHAGPAFQQQQFEQTAQILASSNAPRDVVDEPVEVDHSIPTLLAKLKSTSRKDRWEAARWLAHAYDIGDQDSPSVKECLACVPVLVDVLEHHDEHSVGTAEDASDKLMDLQQYGEDIKSAMTRCLSRAKEKLATLEAAFAPIKDKAVPERVTLNTRIQEYGALVKRLQQHLSNWKEEVVKKVEEVVETAQKPAAPTTQPKPGIAGIIEKILSLFKK